jgi:hypothetical protein
MENKNLDKTIEIIVNGFKIEANIEALKVNSLLFKKSIKFHKEYTFKIDNNTKQKIIKLFFELLEELDESKINIINFQQLYFLSEYFQSDIIKNSIINFALESKTFMRYTKILNDFLINNAQTLIYSNSKKLLEIYSTEFVNKLHINELFSLSKILKHENIIVDLYKYYDFLKCKYTESSNIINFDHSTIKRFKDGDTVVVPKNQLDEMLDKYTYGLIKLLPWELDGFIFSGGLLYDTVTNIQNYKLDKSDYTKMMNINLFLYGYVGQRKIILQKIINNLSCVYSITVNIHAINLINILIEGIPRIIQLILLDEENLEDTVNNFSDTYTKMFYKQNNLFCTISCIKALINQKSMTWIFSNKVQNFKALNRGLTIENNNKLFMYINNISPNTVDFNKILNYDDNEIKNEIIDIYTINNNEIRTINDFLNTNQLTFRHNFDTNYDTYIYNIELIQSKLCLIYNYCRFYGGANDKIYRLNPPNMFLQLKNIKIIYKNNGDEFEGENIIFFTYNKEDNALAQQLFDEMEQHIHQINMQHSSFNKGPHNANIKGKDLLNIFTRYSPLKFSSKHINCDVKHADNSAAQIICNYKKEYPNCVIVETVDIDQMVFDDLICGNSYNFYASIPVDVEDDNIEFLLKIEKFENLSMND